ncbi:MAG: hypothetical protein V1833_03685, partial [Elusimicrobiota bacterium]
AIGAFCVNNTTDSVKIREGYTLLVDSITVSGNVGGLTISTNVFIISGNVGIGTAVPGAKLDVRGSDTQTYNLAVGTSTAYSMVVSTPGNVGIGTAVPLSKLTIVDGDIRISTTTGSRGIIFQNGSVQSSAAGSGSIGGGGTAGKIAKFINDSVTIGDSVITELAGNVGIGTTAPAAKFHIYDVAGATFVVTSAGNVGIGTTDPQAELDIRGNYPTLYLRPNSGYGPARIRFYGNTNEKGNWYIYHYNGLGFAWNENGSTPIGRFGFTQGGRLGINVFTGTEPDIIDSSMFGNLDIRQIANGDTVFYAKRYTDVSPTGNFLRFDNAAGTGLMVVDIIGNIGIGTTVPNSKFQVAGSFALPVVTKTAIYTANGTDYTILCDATAAAFTVNLPTAVGITGRIYTIKKIDSSVNAVTVDGAGTETIDGTTTASLSAQWGRIIIQSDGANWQRID